MKKTTLPVALIQERNHGDADANLAVIEQRVAEAAKRGAKLVLLQELHNGPYFCQHENVCEFDLAETIPGPSTAAPGTHWRSSHGVVLVSSLFETPRRRAVPQHRGGLRSRRLDRRQVPQDAHPGRSGLLREVLLHPGRHRLRTDRHLGRPPRRDGVLGPVVSGRRAPDGAGRRRTAALSRPRSAGTRTDEQDEKDRQRNAWILSHRGHAVANGLPVLSVQPRRP